MVGQTLAHYEVTEKLGQGGMGEVYLAHDTRLDRKVALKVLPSGFAEREDIRGRFEREAKALAAMNHPGIVQVYRSRSRTASTSSRWSWSTGSRWPSSFRAEG